ETVAEADERGARVGGSDVPRFARREEGDYREQKYGFNSRWHNEKLIQVRALTKSIDTGTHRVDILKGIDLEIPQGQFAAIMGPSGSGKSTLLGLLAGLDSPTSGQVILDGEDITNLGEDEMAVLRGRKIGFVFQSYQLLPTLTAEENVLLPMELAGRDL